MRKFIFLVPLISLLACQNNKDLKISSESKSLLGTWRLADVVSNEKKQSEDKLLEEAQIKEQVKKGFIYNFFSDGSFTILAEDNVYSYGSWNLNENETKLSLNRQGKIDHENFSFEEPLNGKARMKISQINGKETFIFIREANELKKFEEDPFYHQNNLWRLKPTISENKIQINERLANYIKHMAYILKASEERKEKIVSFEFSLGIVKIYNGGIGVEDWNLIPDTWKESFLDDQEAQISHDLFTNYMRKSRYRGAGTGNWVKDDYDILTSIYGDLKSGKFIE